MADDNAAPGTEHESVGDHLARVFAEQLNVLDRLTATRDTAHEMIAAGAEQDVTPRLAADQRPVPFTDADYAAGEEAAPDHSDAPAPQVPPGN